VSVDRVVPLDMPIYAVPISMQRTKNDLLSKLRFRAQEDVQSLNLRDVCGDRRLTLYALERVDDFMFRCVEF
jgi:hypothetical protein